LNYKVHGIKKEYKWGEKRININISVYKEGFCSILLLMNDNNIGDLL